MGNRLYKFRCIKDVFMIPSGGHAFVKGKVYYGMKQSDDYYNLKDDLHEFYNHGAPRDFIMGYFTPQFKYGK